MKFRFLLIPMILVTSAALADTHTPARPLMRADAQAQAALLLSGSQMASAATARSPARSLLLATSTDAQRQAAALLSGLRPRHTAKGNDPDPASTRVRVTADAQSQAAALLSRPRAM